METKPDRITFASRVLGGAISVAKTNVFRLDRLSDAQVDERLAICRTCPGGHVVLKRNGMPHSCGPLLAGGGIEKGRPCGCLLRQKARDAKQNCPFDFWPSVDNAKYREGEGVVSQATIEETVAVEEVSFANHARNVAKATGNGKRVRLFLDVANLRDQKRQKRDQRSIISTIGPISEETPEENRENLPEPIQPDANLIPKHSELVSASNPDVIESLYDYFDRVVVVNLDRRPDRLARLHRHLSEIGWPFKFPERFRAVDGNFVKPPKWWRAGPHAWGCHQSHLQIMEQAMMDDINSILVLEDDVFFSSDFRDQVKEFLGEVPGDWQQLYLGGQHLYQRQQLPVRIGKNVLIPYNVNRTHAFALHRRGLQPIYQWLTDYIAHSRTPNFHIDHRLGALHSTGSLRVYSPINWLAGQFESHSNIKCQQVPTRQWNCHEFRDHTELFVAVIGLHRSGSSSLAGLLHKLGVHMGDRLSGYESTGGFEAVGLSRLCEQAFPFPSTKLAMQPGVLRFQLNKHIRHVQTSAKKKGKVAGGKYPHLCAMGEDLKAVCGPGLRIIAINRPLEESIASLVSRSRKAKGGLAISDEAAIKVQQWLWQEKHKFLSENDHLSIDYHNLIRRPKREIDRIVSFLGIEAGKEARESAANHIRPDLAKHLMG